MKKLTLSEIQVMPVAQRRQLYENAKRLAATRTEAQELVELIENSGLDYESRQSVHLDDRIGKSMQRIIFSSEGKAAVVKAAKSGLTSLAGVDPLLRQELGSDYCSENEATVQAGYLVANLMRQLGYVESGSARLPSGCVAKSGMLFKK
jgi:hypothetical protein